MGTTLTPPEMLSVAALQSTDPVFPAWFDRVRKAFETKLGWAPADAQRYFAAWKKQSGHTQVTMGFLLIEIYRDYDIETATLAYRTIWWCQHERELRRQSNREQKRNGKRAGTDPAIGDNGRH